MSYSGPRGHHGGGGRHHGGRGGWRGGGGWRGSGGWRGPSYVEIVDYTTPNLSCDAAAELARQAGVNSIVCGMRAFDPRWGFSGLGAAADDHPVAATLFNSPLTLAATAIVAVGAFVWWRKGEST